MDQKYINLSYLVAAVCFIFALKAMASPKTARKGNLLGAAGMLIAILFTLTAKGIGFGWILAGLIVGSGVGAYLALTVKMTAMPQMVAMFNGFGGLASAMVVLVGIFMIPKGFIGRETAITTAITSLIGWVTFTGSLMAFAKLQDLIPTRPITFKLNQIVNLALLALLVLLIVLVAIFPAQRWLIAPIAVISAVLGVLFVIPIGGADMPVVISLLNSYSGLAAAAAGFVLGNVGLIVAGALVGASGVILTNLMCKAMNRSLANVLFGAFGQVAAGGPAGDAQQRNVTAYTPDDAAMVLDAASLVIIVPGYGMAVAQAQHAVKELADLLAARGTTVKFAIHPVAGRMPGHMNVLLAEADVPYDQLCEMDEINPEFEIADAAIVLGANDVVNPAARSDKSSPIYGMPILNVDKARTVFVCKRSMRPGFAGIDNELFYQDNTRMIFGDAKATMTAVAAALKE